MKKFRKILFSFIMSFALAFSAGAVVFSKFDNQTAFAAANGGSVYVGNNSTNILEGRKSICGFDATNGGGVYIANGGTFKMTGGDIFANKASMGGGVYVLTGGTFNLSGGSISQNQATGKNVDGITHGGGVYSAGTFNMSGGSIVENKNNGIYVSSGATTISGGTIAGNGENAIYVGGGTLKVKGGTIVGNIEGKASSVAISGGEIRGNVSTNSVTGGTIYGTVKTNVALSIYGNATILSNGTYAVLSSNGDIIIDKAKIIGDVKAESGNIRIYKNSDITGKIIISDPTKSIILDDWTTDFVPTYTLDFSSLTSVDTSKAYFVFANTMGTQADTSKMTIVAPDGYKAVSKMVNGTNGIYFEVEKVDFPANWKAQINASTYMTTTVTPGSITSLKFVSSVPSGYTKIGTLSTGLPVYKGTTVTAIAFVLSKKISAPVDSANLFYNLSEITSFDFSNFDTSVVKNMNSMFRFCNKLTSLDISKFNTAKVTNMSYMFNCSLLSSITFGNGFSFNEVIDLSYMFDSCSLTSINLSPYLNSSTNYKFFTMESMFSNCGVLETINLGTFNAPVLDSTNSMFYGCSSLTSINMKILKTNYLRTTAGMFSSCSNLTSLDLSGFVTKNVITMDNMFESCDSLASITWDESFDTINVCDMSCMFYNCSALTSLNLKNFNTQNVVSFSNMFYGCGSLRTIFNMNFLTINAINFEDMFSGCGSLLFLDLSSFNMKNAQNITNFLRIDSGDLKYLCTPRFFDYQNYSDGFGSAESLQSANGKFLSDLSSTLSYSEAYVADASDLEQITISGVAVDGSLDSCFHEYESSQGSFYVYNGLFNKYMFPLEYGNCEDYDFTYGDDFKAKLTARTIEFAWFEFGIVTGQMGYYSSADGLEDLYIHVLDGSGTFEMNYSNPGVAVDVVLILNSADTNFQPYGEYSLYYRNLTWGLSANDSFGDEVVISNANIITKTFTNLTFEKLMYCLPSYPIFDVGNMFFKCWRIGFNGTAEADYFYSNNWVLSWENLANLPDISSVISDMENATGYSNTIFVYPEIVSYDTVFADASASSDATNTAINTNGGGEDVMNGLFSLDLSLYGNEKCIIPDNKKTTGVVTEENKVS